MRAYAHPCLSAFGVSPDVRIHLKRLGGSHPSRENDKNHDTRVFTPLRNLARFELPDMSGAITL